jgi:small-conductance mechanosensitive channel
MLWGIDTRLTYAVIVALAGLMVTRWALRQPTRTRIAVGLVYLGIDTYVLSQAGILPIRSGPPPYVAEWRTIAAGLQIFWWYVLARCLISIGRVFLLYKHQLHERKFATDLLAGVVYLFAAFAVTGFVFEVPVTGLLATSGAMAIVLGLALQSTANDLFSGIALSIERPYRIGDVVGLEEDVEGTVTEITWRAIHIMSFTQDDVIVPNSVIAKKKIVNYSYPVRAHGTKLTVSFNGATPPCEAIALLCQALPRCGSVLRTPRPMVTTSQMSAASIDYVIAFFVERYETAGQTKSAVLDIIHRHAEWAGVALARPTRDMIFILQQDDSPRVLNRAAMKLDRVRAFDELTQAERDKLAATMTRRDAEAGELIFQENQPGEALFVIAAGVVGIGRADGSGGAAETARLGPGDVIGADPVMAGSVRQNTAHALTRCTLYEIPGPILAALISEHPRLASKLFRPTTPSVRAEVTTSVDGEPNLGIKGVPRLLDQFTRFFQP